MEYIIYIIIYNILLFTVIQSMLGILGAHDHPVSDPSELAELQSPHSHHLERRAGILRAFLDVSKCVSWGCVS